MKLMKLTLIALFTLILLTFISCSQGGSSGAAMIPDGKFNVLININTQEFFDSDVWEEIQDEIGDDGVEALFGELEEEISVKMEDLKDVVIGLELEGKTFVTGKQPDNALIYIGGEYDKDDVEDRLKDSSDADELDEDDREGIEMFTWVSKETEKGVAFLPQGYVRGMLDNVEDAVDLLKKGGKRLINSKDYLEFGQLFSDKATISINAWELDDMLGDLLKMAGQMVTDDDDKDMLEALEELKAASLLINFDKEIGIVIKLHLDDEDAVETLGDYLEEIQDKKNEHRLLAGVPLDKSTKDLMDEIKIDADKNVLTIALDLETDSELVQVFLESFKNASEKANVANTVMAVKQLGTAVEQYIMDFPAVGCPKSANVEDLAALLEEIQFITNKDIGKDSWGNDLVYSADPELGGRKYRITSYGSDGQAGPAPANPGTNANAKEDIIWENGWFVQR